MGASAPASTPTVPGTDGYGFVGSPARCAGGETLQLALLTSKANGSCVCRAVNRDTTGKNKDDTIYTVSSGGLEITRGDGRAVSSAVVVVSLATAVAQSVTDDVCARLDRGDRHGLTG